VTQLAQNRLIEGSHETALKPVKQEFLAMLRKILADQNQSLWIALPQTLTASTTATDALRFWSRFPPIINQNEFSADDRDQIMMIAFDFAQPSKVIPPQGANLITNTVIEEAMRQDPERELLSYLDRLDNENQITRSVRKIAEMVWQKLKSTGHPVPDAAPGANQNLLLAFDNGDYYCEIEILANQKVETFSSDRSTGKIGNEEFGSVSDFINSLESNPLLSPVQIWR